MKEKLLVGATWLVASKLIVNILSTLSILVLAKYLNPDDFGLVAIVMAIATILQAVTDLSLSSVIIQLNHISEHHYHTAWTLGVIRGLIIFLAFVLLAPFVVSYYEDIRLKDIMYVLGMSMFFYSLLNPKLSELSRNLIFWQEFVVDVTQKIFAITVSIYFAVTLKSYWAIVYGFVISQVVGVLVSYLIFPYVPKFSFRYFREIFSFSSWITLSRIVSTINWKFDHLVVGDYLGSKSLGFYSVGDNLAVIPTREIIQPLQKTLFSGFSRVSDQSLKLKYAYIKSQALITMFALPIGVGFALIAEPFVTQFMGEKWSPITQLIQVFACVYGLQSIGSQATAVAMSLGKTKVLYYRELLGLGVRLPLILILINYWSISGVIVARVISGVFSLVLNMNLLSKFLNITYIEQINHNIRAIANTLVMAMLIMLVKNTIELYDVFIEAYVQLITYVLCGLVFYALSSIVLWIAVGKPYGPEQEILEMFFKIFSTLKKKLLNIKFYA